MSNIVAEHRGCKVWRNTKTTRTVNVRSGAVVSRTDTMKSLYVAGENIKMRGPFYSVKAAIADIDFQLDYPSPLLKH